MVARPLVRGRGGMVLVMVAFIVVIIMAVTVVPASSSC